MSEPGSAARPRSDIFEYAGATVEVVDAATILAAARVNPVELMRRSAFPPPVRRVDLSVASADGGPADIAAAGGAARRSGVSHAVRATRAAPPSTARRDS